MASPHYGSFIFIFLLIGTVLILLVGRLDGGSVIITPAVRVVRDTTSSLEECSKREGIRSIAFPIPVTSRKLSPDSVYDLPLLQYALPTIFDSVELEKYDYRIDIGADSGDVWYDNTALTDEIHAWWVGLHRKHGRKCYIPLYFHVYKNTHSRNTWSSNYMTQIEYELGYDAFYRINDDTILYPDSWSSVFFDIMDDMKPIPGLGVTGPWDSYHDGGLLTHSFIMRKHIEVFGCYFPFVYGNYYSDNHIQEIYRPPFNISGYKGDIRMLVFTPNIRVKHKKLAERYIRQDDAESHRLQVYIDRKTLSRYLSRNI